MATITKVVRSFVSAVESAVSTLPNEIAKVVDESVAVAETPLAIGVQKVAALRDVVAVVEAHNWTGAERVVVVTHYVALVEAKNTVGPIVKVVSEQVAVAESASCEKSLEATPPTAPRDRPSRLDAVIADIAPPDEEGSERATVYAYIANTSRNAPARSVLAYENVGGGQTVILGSLQSPSTMGYVISKDIRPHQRHVIDRASTIDVRVTSGEIESVTEGELHGGANRVYLAGMVFGFQTATQLTEVHEYRLSGILWGLLDTPIHPQDAGQVWAMVDGPRLPIPVPWSSLDQDRRISFVPAGYAENEDGDDYVDTRLVGRSVVPLEVANIQGSKDANNDWAITWDRVSRLPRQRLFSPRAFKDIDPQTYTVEILSGSSVVRTITTTSETASYTNAQQTTDFGTDQDTLTIQVTRTSDNGNSRSTPATVSVPHAAQEPYPE